MINKSNRSTSVAVRTKEFRSLGCAAMQCFVARNKRLAASSRKRPTCTAHNCWCYCLPSSGQRTHLHTPHLPLPQLSLPSHPPCTLVRCRNISYFLFLWWKVSGASKLYSLETGPLGQAGTIVISGARSGPLCGDLTVNTSCDDRGLAAGLARWSQAALEMWTMVACWTNVAFLDTINL